MIAFVSRLAVALHRSRAAIITMALANVLSVAAGIVMVSAGSQFALRYRDRLVARAIQNDPASIAFNEGARLRAALLDFSRNLGLGAAPETVTGLTVVSPYVFGLYRGWVGGIVSIDRQHRSRLREAGPAVSYLVTLVLQLIPYSLAGGIGVHLGLTYFRRPAYYAGPRIMGYPVDALKDVARVYALIAPLFLVASLWEFLNPWA
jgi:hypothetical protein